MGMFDWYTPEPPLHCQSCGAELSGWQGKDGPCGLIQWSQGAAAPTGQAVDEECALLPEDLAKRRLPSSFRIYTACDACDRWHDASALCEDGVWQVTALGSGDATRPRIAARVVSEGWRACSACAHAWQHPEGHPLCECPECHALTDLGSAD